jgi:hypothetical protein
MFIALIMYLLLTPYVEAQQQELRKPSTVEDKALDGNKDFFLN